MPLWKTIRLEVFTLRFFLLSLLFSFLYIFLFVFIPNNKLLLYSFVNFPIHTTFNLFTSLVVGLPKSVSGIDLLLLLVTAGLVGVNISLILKTLKRLKNQKVRISVGGGTILAIVATGCSACGLSIISLFGLIKQNLRQLSPAINKLYYQTCYKRQFLKRLIVHTNAI